MDGRELTEQKRDLRSEEKKSEREGRERRWRKGKDKERKQDISE